jgi:hypothetical protein
MRSSGHAAGIDGLRRQGWMVGAVQGLRASEGSDQRDGVQGRDTEFDPVSGAVS